MNKLSGILFASVFLVSGAAIAGETEAPKGYKSSGEPITNPAEPGYDPDLIVCRMEDRTGSRAKRREVCLANYRWQRVAREGNAFSKALVDGSRGGSAMAGW